MTAAIAFCGALSCRADLADAFHQIEGRLDDALLDTYSGTTDSTSRIDFAKSLEELKPYARSTQALQLLEIEKGDLSLAAQIGQARARIEHVAASEMLRCQKAGDLPEAQAWRTLITLPQFANSVSGEMLLQTVDLEKAKSSEVSNSLAKEYLQWQTMRVRQLLDFLQEQVVQNIATKEVVEAYGAEIRTLSDFPPALLQAGGVKTPGALPEAMKWPGNAAQTLVNQLAPVWKQEEPKAYELYRHFLDLELGGLRSMLLHYAAQEKIQDQARPDFEGSRE